MSEPAPPEPPERAITSRRAFRGFPRRNTRRASVAENRDQRGALVGDGHDDLRLDGAVLECIDDGLLQLDRGAAGCANGARIGNRYVSVHVDGLARKGNEIARAHAGLGWNEQPAGACLENGHAQDVADADAKIPRPASVREGSQPRHGLGQYLGHFRGDPDERVGKALGVALARQHVHAQRAGGRQDAAAAKCQRSQ
jgi:hypothetical protein